MTHPLIQRALAWLVFPVMLFGFLAYFALLIDGIEHQIIERDKQTNCESAQYA